MSSTSRNNLFTICTTLFSIFSIGYIFGNVFNGPTATNNTSEIRSKKVKSWRYGVPDSSSPTALTYSTRYGSSYIDGKATNETSSKLPNYIMKGPGGFRNKPVPVVNIALLGERNSGTNWLTSELEKCFPDIPSQPSLIRWKHWFQEDFTENTPEEHGTLVIALFRNIYDWLDSMRLRPHNMPNHMNLEWKEFVTTPWTMARPQRDLNLVNNFRVNLKDRICQSNFTYDEVISCVAGTVPTKKKKNKGNIHRSLRSEYQPIYELRNDKSGLPYMSIVDMRADKIRNHLAVADWDWVTSFISVQYEKLLINGTEFLWQQIEELTGTKAQCDPSPPQPERLSHYPHPPSFEKWVGENSDWNAEGMIGYKAW